MRRRWMALEYALIDKTGKHSLADFGRFRIGGTISDPRRAWCRGSGPVGGCRQAVPGDDRPDKLLAYKIPINKVVEQIRRGNQEVGGRVLEFTGTEYMVRGRGYILGSADIETLRSVRSRLDTDSGAGCRHGPDRP